jgi:hypothetical protein
MAHPVFFDENGRRAHIVNITLVLVSCICAVLLVSVVYALLVAPALPRLDVVSPAAGAPVQIAPANQIGVANKASSAQPIRLAANRQVSQSAAQTLRLAFYAAAPGALPSLKLHAAELDAIIPRWLTVTAENGQAEVKALERASSDRIIRWLQWNAPNLAIYPEISSELTGSQTLALLASPTSRLQIIDGISSYLEENDFQGVTVQLFEPPLSGGGQSVFVNFLWELGEHLRARQRRPAATEAQGNPEATRLIARASELLGQGNIGAARIVLERAAEMGSAHASFMLAETYDPVILSAWGTFGTRGEATKAREFYAKAHAGGIQQAKDRLDALSQ